MLSFFVAASFLFVSSILVSKFNMYVRDDMCKPSSDDANHSKNKRSLSINELVEKVDIALQDLERQKFVSFHVPFEGMPDGMTYAKSIIVSYVMYHSSRGWFDVPESFDALFRGETLDEGLESVELDDSEIDGVAFAANHKKNMH